MSAYQARGRQKIRRDTLSDFAMMLADRLEGCSALLSGNDTSVRADRLGHCPFEKCHTEFS